MNAKAAGFWEVLYLKRRVYPSLAGGCYRSSSPCCLATGFLTIRHSAHPRQPDRSAPHTQHSASTLTGTTCSAYHCYWPCPCHSLGSFQTLEGSITAVSSVTCCPVLTRAALGRGPLVTRGVGVGPAACPSAGCARGQSTLAAHSSPAVQSPGSRARLLPLPGSDQSPAARA